jgi:adenylate kinase
MARKIMSEGRLGPDDVIMDLVRKRIQRKDCLKGYILDGFPRTVSQATLMDDLDRIDLVINLVVSEELIIDRLTSRRNCRNCSAVYNLSDNKPATAGICDDCGGVLYKREDDNEVTISKRMETYMKQTLPLALHYRKMGILKDIPAGGSIDETYNGILELIEKIRFHSDSTY